MTGRVGMVRAKIPGHLLTDENVYRFRQSQYHRRIGRACRICRREASRRYDAKRRAL